MPDINVNKLSEALNTKADIDLNNTGVFSTSGGGGVNLTSSTPVNASGKEVTSADFFKSNLLNYTTNRILEIPQDIKLEINNGNLTLKAGSKLRRLTGEEYVVKNDFSLNTSYYGFNQTCLIIPGSTDNGVSLTNLETPKINICSSGTTIPTSTTSQYHWFFKTDTKEYYWTHDNGATWERRAYAEFFPIAIANIGAEKWTSIDQIFNGFGYIGSTFFVLPGIKCLVGNGRKHDGSCITKIEESTKVSTLTTTLNRQNNKIVLYNGSVGARFNLWFDEQANICCDDNGVNTVYQPTAILGTFSTETTSPWNIKEFNPLGVDSFVNSNASNFSKAGESYLSSLSMPSNRYIDLTLGATEATYTAPANGLFALSVNYSTGGYMNMYVAIGERYGYFYKYDANVWVDSCLVVKKGATIIIQYQGTATVHAFKFIYAEGEN